MDPVKEQKLTKNVGIISAIVLVIILAVISYFLISNQQMKKIVQIEIKLSEEPAQSRKTNNNENELLYAVVEMSRSVNSDSSVIGKPLKGSPGVFIIDMSKETEQYILNGYGTEELQEIPFGYENSGLIINK